MWPLYLHFDVVLQLGVQEVEGNRLLKFRILWERIKEMRELSLRMFKNHRIIYSSGENKLFKHPLKGFSMGLAVAKAHKQGEIIPLSFLNQTKKHRDLYSGCVAACNGRHLAETTISELDRTVHMLQCWTLPESQRCLETKA